MSARTARSDRTFRSDRTGVSWRPQTAWSEAPTEYSSKLQNIFTGSQAWGADGRAISGDRGYQATRPEWAQVRPSSAATHYTENGFGSPRAAYNGGASRNGNQGAWPVGGADSVHGLWVGPKGVPSHPLGPPVDPWHRPPARTAPKLSRRRGSVATAGMSQQQMMAAASQRQSHNRSRSKLKQLLRRQAQGEQVSTSELQARRRRHAHRPSPTPPPCGV
jgi:hypothetical protein